MKQPTRFTHAVVDAICARLAAGESLRSICRDPKMPAQGTVFVWLARDKALQERYARARELQADVLFDQILEIADDGRNDTYTDDEGNVRTDHDVIARSRLRVDARKWMAGKLRPKVYGDKLELAGDPQAPLMLQKTELTDDRLAAIAAIASGSRR